MTKILIITSLLLMFLYSCRTISCTNQYLSAAFIGFSTSDIDTIILRKYKQNDNFLHLIDTTLFTNNLNNVNSPAYLVSNDTTFVVFNIYSGEETYLIPGYDWQIYIPTKNKTISISNIISPQQEYKCFGDDCGCLNPIDSFAQNGQYVIPVPENGKNNYAYYPLYINILNQ